MRFKLFVFLLILYFPVLAQKEGQPLIDSLLFAKSATTNDTTKAKILNRVAVYYTNANIDSAFKYVCIGLQLATKMKWDKGIAAFNTCYGNIFSTKGQLDSSISRHLKALYIFKKIKDSLNLAIAYNNLGTVSKAKSDFVAATQFFLQTLQIGKNLQNDFTIGLAYENLSLVYQYQSDNIKWRDYAKLSIATYQAGDVEEMTAGPLEVLGSFYLHQKQYDSASYYYNKSLGLYRKYGNKIKEATLLNSYAEFYASQQDYQSAVAYGLQAKKIWDSTGPSFEDAVNNTGIIGFYYLQLSKKTNAGKDQLLKLAAVYLEEAVIKSRAAGNKTSQLEFQHSLAEVNALSANYKDAYNNLETYQYIKDSVFSQENKNKIAALENQQAIDLKNRQIENKELQISNQQNKMWLLVIVILFLVSVAILVLRQSMLQKKTNTILLRLNNELDEANKVKAKFFGILSHDLRSPVANLINFLQLQKRRPGVMSEAAITERENKIETSAKSLLETMDTMLLWSKGQMEHFSPTIAAIHVSTLFSSLKKNWENTEHVIFSYNCESNLVVRSDEHYLYTIMHNLTANAVKAMLSTNGALIEWKAWRENDTIFLSVADNGPGTSNEQVKALYDETASSSSKNGLGLHIVRDLAKAIGCTVALQPQTGTGTMFILSI